MLDSTIKITDAGQQQIEKISKQHDNQFVRLAIVSGGCNGYSKTWSFDKNIASDDMVIPVLSTKLLIDNVSLNFLQNATIDFKQDLMGKYFVIDIPEAISSCGCGTSFSI